MDVSELVILTGAGFTKNVGGYLGSEMHTVIANHKNIRAYPQLKSIMERELLKGGNFESAYARVLEADYFSDAEREAMKQAIVDAYKEMHREVTHFRKGENPDHFNFKGMLTHFAKIMNRNSQERCFIFTLNQDLFFEHWFNWFAPAAPRIGEGIDPEEAGFESLNPDVTLDDVNKAIEMHAGPPYLKLHGSYGWLSSDGEHSLVIGTQKEDQIRRESLLHIYFCWFKEVLMKYRNRKLLIIGYGFRDSHINEVLKESIQMNDTRLYIINPRDQGSFLRSMYENDLDEIAEGIECYYPWLLKDIFYSQKAPKWERICQDLLET